MSVLGFVGSVCVHGCNPSTAREPVPASPQPTSLVVLADVGNVQWVDSAVIETHIPTPVEQVDAAIPIIATGETIRGLPNITVRSPNCGLETLEPIMAVAGFQASRSRVSCYLPDNQLGYRFIPWNGADYSESVLMATLAARDIAVSEDRIRREFDGAAADRDHIICSDRSIDQCVGRQVLRTGRIVERTVSNIDGQRMVVYIVQGINVSRGYAFPTITLHFINRTPMLRVGQQAEILGKAAHNGRSAVILANAIRAAVQGDSGVQ